MNELKTPIEWTVKTMIFSRQDKSNSTYNFDGSKYSETPTVLNLCWLPIDADTSVKEQGKVNINRYQAVIYDSNSISEGDLVHIETIGWFEIQSIEHYISHKLVTVISTERRQSSV